MRLQAEDGHKTHGILAAGFRTGHKNGQEYDPEHYGISIDHVSFSYGDNEVLKDISLEIPENTMTAFVGSSGAGKTTLAMLIARFWDVDKGSISIGGRDVRD